MTTTFSLKQGETRTNSVPIPHPLNKKLVHRFSVKPAVTKKSDKKPESSRQQRKLRRLKKDAKQQFEQALRDRNKSEAAHLKKDFFKLVRLHSKVRSLEPKSKEKRADKETTSIPSNERHENTT